MLKPYNIKIDGNGTTSEFGQSECNSRNLVEASYSICFSISMDEISYTTPSSLVKQYDVELPP